MNYSNFHRARKWHRKFDAALFQGFIWKIEHCSDLYYKYLELAEKKDGHKISHIKRKGITRLELLK